MKGYTDELLTSVWRTWDESHKDKEVNIALTDIITQYGIYPIVSWSAEDYIKEVREAQRGVMEHEYITGITNLIIKIDKPIGVIMEAVREEVSEENLKDISNRHLYNTIDHLWGKTL